MAASTFVHRSIKLGDAKDLDLNGQNIVNSGNASDFSKSRSGSYTGDATTNRAIAHGLGAVPKVVIISTTAANYPIGEITASTNLRTVHNTGDLVGVVTAWDATNFYVGTGVASSLNDNTATFKWVAIS